MMMGGGGGGGGGGGRGKEEGNGETHNLLDPTVTKKKRPSSLVSRGEVFHHNYSFKGSLSSWALLLRFQWFVGGAGPYSCDSSSL